MTAKLTLSSFRRFEWFGKFVKLEPVQNQEFQPPEYNEPLATELSALPAQDRPVSPNNPPWGVVPAVFTWIFSVVAILFFPVLFVGPYLLMYRDQGAAVLTADPTLIILNIAGIIPAHLATLAFAWFVVTQKGKYSVTETLGFKSGGFQWWHYPLLLIGFFGLAVVVSLILPEGENELMKMLRSSRGAVIITAFLATFTAPLVEEVVYRGILYSGLQRRFGVSGAVVLVTVMFALVHVPQYWGSPATIVLIFLLSLGLTLIRVKSNNLLPCVIMHTIFNGIQSVGLLLEPYFKLTNEPVPVSFILRLFQ